MDDEEFMTPGEVARFFRVNAKTVQRWDAAGKLRSFRTLGGHRRFYRSEVVALAAKEIPEYGKGDIQESGS